MASVWLQSASEAVARSDPPILPPIRPFGDYQSGDVSRLQELHLSRAIPQSPPASSEAVAATMRGNRKRDTRPELIVRRLLHRLGYRYRTHVAELPGRPDIVFTKRRIVVQVHGCFWHQHSDPGCPLAFRPRSNTAYWDAKLSRNVERDAEQASRLEALSWRLHTVWECECHTPDLLQAQLVKLLGPPRISRR